MKKILISIILCGCKTAVSREIKTETRYNQIEINAAMDEIEMEFANCTLLELSFDERLSILIDGETDAKYNNLIYRKKDHTLK